MVQEPTFRYLDRTEICRIRGIGKTKQFSDEKNGYFPQGERFGLRVIRWRSDVVARWLEQESIRAAARSGEIVRLQSEAAHKGVEERRRKAQLRADVLASQA